MTAAYDRARDETVCTKGARSELIEETPALINGPGMCVNKSTVLWNS